MNRGMYPQAVIEVLDDDIRYREEEHPRRAFECFQFELPDTVHEDIGRSESRLNEAAPATVAGNLELAASVANENRIESVPTGPQTWLSNHLLQGGTDDRTIQPQTIAHLGFAVRSAHVVE